MTSNENHLLIFGASGVSWWASVKEALRFPSSTTFGRLTGLTNRPLSIETSRLPRDDRLQLVSGIDLTDSVHEVTASKKQKISDIETVTHVIFTAYFEKPDYESLRVVNTQILETGVGAVEQLAQNLRIVVLQTGGKGYGVEFADKLEINPPLKESQSRIPEPHYDNIFYYSQHDLLKRMSSGKAWTFSEIRSDVIIGFSNFMNCAQGLGIWLFLARQVEETILARMEIHAAVNHDKCGNGGTFNVADGDVVTWADKWPGICSYFGLEGTGPAAEPHFIEEYVKKHSNVGDKLVEQHRLKEGIMQKFSRPFLYFVSNSFDFDRHHDLSQSRTVGFEEKVDTVQEYVTAFERMREVHIMP